MTAAGSGPSIGIALLVDMNLTPRWVVDTRRARVRLLPLRPE